ncbi:hypothetical protein CPB84DRAFT_1851924 [Gymnopilus junonius]|uniref:Uncharacterized protein n=1 Tax=Gymnopilus junonius TaxID=109634 RepID=A0A9P5NDL8_GYMJU|nr:hypothetical protein CPB84DRAFT_1851924 [Gymnopilus junonius]
MPPPLDTNDPTTPPAAQSNHVTFAVGTSGDASPSISLQQNGNAQGAATVPPVSGPQTPLNCPFSDPEELCQTFSKEAFLDALINFVASEDVSINIIGSPKLRALFLMLHENLRDADIPHRTALREHIMKTWEDYIASLQVDLENALGKISFTVDAWSDPNLAPFLGVTGHWIKAKMSFWPFITWKAVTQAYIL